MEQKTRIVIDKIKAEFTKQGRMMRQLNKMLPIQGERRVIALPDRKIDLAFYPASRAMAPLIIGLHGGGFVFGGSAMDDDMWCAVRDALDVNIVSLDYRKCPDYRWPAPVEDVYDCACYLKEHAQEYGFDPANMSVMGCSAGANLAATACLKAKQEGVDLYRYQILLYPSVDLVTHPAEKGEEHSFQPETLLAFNELYVDEKDLRNVLVSSVFASEEELNGLPECILVVAEKDELKHEGLRYGEMLEAAGVKVSGKQISGMAHAYFENGYIKDIRGRDLDEVSKQAWMDGTMQQACEETLAFLQSCYK